MCFTFVLFLRLPAFLSVLHGNQILHLDEFTLLVEEE